MGFAGAQETATQRLFTTFPRGRFGVGLLLLRVTVATTAAVQGYALLGGAAPGGRLSGVLLFGAAVVLAAGVLTIVAAGLTLAALIGAATISAPLSICAAHSPGALAFVGSVCVGVMLLGPGGYSLDARLFGRREIVIPRATRPPE